MRPTFDIFTVSPDGEPLWIESVETLENAREDLMETARIAPRRDCFIYSKDGGIVEVILRADFQEFRRTYSLTGEHNNSRSYRSFCADLSVFQSATEQIQ
jgi:phosphoketolase